MVAQFDFVKEYNSRFKDNVIAIMLDTKSPEVRSGDVPQQILLSEGQEFNFTIRRGVSTNDTVVNYVDFVNDVDVGDIVLVDEKDWEDIKFGVDNGVDFYAVSFVKSAAVVHELKDYLKDLKQLKELVKHLTLSRIQTWFRGLFWKAARIGERLSPWVSPGVLHNGRVNSLLMVLSVICSSIQFYYEEICSSKHLILSSGLS